MVYDFNDVLFGECNSRRVRLEILVGSFLAGNLAQLVVLPKLLPHKTISGFGGNYAF